MLKSGFTKNSENKIERIEPSNNIDLAKKINTFLENELSRIETVINSGVDFLNGISLEDNQNIIKQLTENSDYLLPHYPLVNYSKSLDSVTTKHILLACYSFSKTIKNTLSIIRLR
jgi:hypothetical protein